MKRSKAQKWQRFYDDVILAGGDWPRPLWRLALEDALCAALPGSPLLNEYRRGVVELSKVEQAAPSSYHARRRRLELEEEIGGIVARADRIIRGDRQAPGMRGTRLRDRTFTPWGRLATAGTAAALGLVIAGGALAGAAWVYEARLASQVDQEVQRHARDLKRSVALLQGELEARVRASQDEQDQLAALQEEVEFGMTRFSAALTDGLETMTGLRQAAVADVEGRLNEEASSIAKVLDRLKGEAAALDQGFAQARQDLAGFKEELPALNDGVVRLSERLGDARAAFASVVDEVQVIRAKVPQLAQEVEARSQQLQRRLDKEAQALSALGTKVAGLQEGLAQSQTAFDSLQKLFTNGAGGAQQDGRLLDAALQDARETGAVVAKLVASAEDDVASLRQLLQHELDATLTEMKDKVDHAVTRGDGALGAAQAEAVRRIEAAGEAALAEVAQSREQKLTSLAAEAAAAQAELEQARASLLASWREMDGSLSERQNQLLSHVDQYADTMHARVQDLLDAVNVMVAEANGTPREAADATAR